MGKDGQDFALSMWLKASGPSNDQTSGDGSQIIGSKSQYNQQKAGFFLHTQSNVTTELQNAGINAEGVEGSCCGKDGRLVLRALSTPADNGWRKTVMSEPFPADTWTHVVLNYRNNANSGETPLQECSNDTCASEFSIYVIYSDRQARARVMALRQLLITPTLALRMVAKAGYVLVTRDGDRSDPSKLPN